MKLCSANIDESDTQQPNQTLSFSWLQVSQGFYGAEEARLPQLKV